MLWDHWCFIITCLRILTVKIFFISYFPNEFHSNDLGVQKLSVHFVIFGSKISCATLMRNALPSHSVHYFRGINYKELFNWPNSKHTTTKSKAKFDIVPSLTRLFSVHCEYTYISESGRHFFQIFSWLKFLLQSRVQKCHEINFCCLLRWPSENIFILSSIWTSFFLHQHFSFFYFTHYLLLLLSLLIFLVVLQNLFRVLMFLICISFYLQKHSQINHNAT